ncbi:hypothetical protein MHU86_16525 [Fragilaria crotonensis]|nr:hypothetical protein MHU86_16525 [Fragilaria crotonensis]
MEFLRKFHERHERLKNYVHNGFRYPLPPWGRNVMGFVYFCMPVVGGYYVMQWAIGRSHQSIGPRGELLKHKEIQGIGDKRILENGEMQSVGGPNGIWSGVKLAVSDEKTQEVNKKNLKSFFKQERKKREKREKLEVD